MQFEATSAASRQATLDSLLAQNALQWLRMGDGPLARMVQVGWDPRHIVNLFLSMPEDWKALLMTTCQALQIVLHDQASKMGKVDMANQVKCASAGLPIATVYKV